MGPYLEGSILEINSTKELISRLLDEKARLSDTERWDWRMAHLAGLYGSGKLRRLYEIVEGAQPKVNYAYPDDYTGFIFRVYRWRGEEPDEEFWSAITHGVEFLTGEGSIARDEYPPHEVLGLKLFPQ